MKIFFASLVAVVVFFLAFSHAEIEARFPGTQPIIIQRGSFLDSVQGTIVDLTVIDDFSVNTSPQVTIILPPNGAPPQQRNSGFDESPTIVGNERDVIITVLEGESGLTFAAGATGGVFTVSTPNSGNQRVELQYDGVDASAQLSTNPGLNGLDLTSGGALGFRLSAYSDIQTEFSLTVVDSSGNSGTQTSFVQAGSIPQSYFLQFSSFPAGVNFGSLSAIEVTIEGLDNVDFVLETFVTYTVGDVPSDCIEGVVLPCDIDYYRLETLSDVQVGDYLKISYDNLGDDNQRISSEGRFYIVSSSFENLQEELASNSNIIDTLGGLPGPNNYAYRCDESCDVEILWSKLENTTYYLAVESHGVDEVEYQICLEYRSVPVFELNDGVPETIFRDRRPTTPPADHSLYYRFFSIDIPQSSFSEGSYLVVNVSRAEPFPGVGLRLMYESLPTTAFDTGIIGSEDTDSLGRRVDNVIFPSCADTSLEGRPNYDSPIRSDPRVPCDCFTDSQLFGDGPAFQLTCQLVVDPCQFAYGTWYASVELPERSEPSNPFDFTGFTNYTITASVVQPTITDLIRNVTFKAFVEPEAIAHFKLDVPAQSTVPGESHLLVHLSNVRNGIVDVFVHQGLGVGQNLAGGPESCVPANATCRTCDACNVVIEKCHFAPGTWYISVGIVYDEVEGFQVDNMDRLPVTFTLRTNWLEDPVPSRLIAGVPVSKYVGEALYDFYVIDVPPTIDTWLFVELYAKANDTEVVLAILHGDLPGGECYARPDFYCMTGDSRGLRYDSGTPAFLENEPVQRESCSFMIQTCELSPGPLYLSVYGHHTDYAAYGDNTFYQVPVHYTLWADFDVALSLTSGVSYSETVFEKQYQHYYIRADQVQQGASLTVEITNIQHGVPQTLEAFVNYNYLAGNCPCYDHLYNCTGASSCSDSSCAKSNDLNAVNSVADIDSVLNCCTIEVPASDFRPGVWYIAVLGMNEDYFTYTTPIGYTLTATVNDAPMFNPLILGQAFQGEVPQWNQTLEYVHFKLAAEALPLNDLVFKATFVQNCDFKGKHDDTTDALWMFVNNGAPATEALGGWVQKCRADTTTESYCTVVIPHCEWEGGDWFVAIQGRYAADFAGRFTLRASLSEVRDFQLSDGVSHYDRVSAGRYQHYFIETTAEEDEYLSIDLYTNQDQDAVTVYLNKDERAGDSPCFSHYASCETEQCCTWQLHACDLEPGRYYISVYGSQDQFYDTSVEYTLTAAHKPVSTLLFNGDPFTGHLAQVGDVNHYRFEVADDVVEGSFLVFSIDNVRHGSVNVYGQKGFLAGRCPCYVWEYTCSASGRTCADDSDVDWCDIRVPSCLLESGEFFFSVWATELLSPDPPVFVTPIGYTIEIDVVAPVIEQPFVEIGRNVNNTEIFQFVDNERYNHYEFTVDDDDFDNGYHIVVEITSVRDGALFVYYNQLLPGDVSEACHISQLCTSGLGAGKECFWQIPYCLVKSGVGEGNRHYISVEGRTGRISASYNILIYKQGVPSIIQNDAFSLDDGLADAPVNGELNILHNKRNEPNGWTQFFQLSDVPASLNEGRGEMLEVFFYRVTNNRDQPMAFNVYLHPNEPAGAHDCCDVSNKLSLGSCQGAPCSNTADTTTSANNGPDVFSHTCNLGSGIGNDENGDALFGERCTVRVWPCEFNKYCTDDVKDWYMSVVPLSPTDLSSDGPGLQYSVQWRVRNLRLNEQQVSGSIDLTPSVNTYQFTETFSVSSDTTESQGWLSFYVDYASRTNSRLSIQTRFTAGEGVVYINGDEFASYTETCNMYMCGSGDDCADSERFIVSECLSLKYSRYYITLRNTGPVGSVTSVQFRLVDTQFPAAIQLSDHPSPSAPFITTSGPSVFPGVSGVQGENYDFYILTIDDDDLDRRQSWVLEIERPSSTSDSGVLDSFIRFGAPPGRFSANNDLEDSEGCHGWQYSCTMEQGERCVYQIPHCDLIEGHWWFAVGNPGFTLDSTPSDLPDYTLTTYISNPPTVLSLNQQFISTDSDSALLQHFTVNITVDEIDFDTRDDIRGFWTKYLRFQLDNVRGGSATMYTNLGNLAGPVSDEAYPWYCPYSTKEVSCTSQCFVDYLPCENVNQEFTFYEENLKTGEWFVSVAHDAGVSFDLIARVYRDDYTPLSLSETIIGTGNRLGAVDNYYTYTATQTELNSNGDGDGNYRYVVDINDGDDDDLMDNRYLVFNFTASAFAQNDASANIEVFRDDCTRFNCALDGPLSWCTIDALTLGPCASKGGRYFIRVESNDRIPFTIDVYYNETTVQTIQESQTLVEVVYPYEYQEYFYDSLDVGEGATLAFDICSICGDVEAFIRADLPAGPSPDISGNDKSCSVDYCRATGPTDTSFEPMNNCCTLFLDTCQFEQRGYYVGVRGVTTTYPNENNPNFYIPAKYSIKPTQTNINVTNISPSCPTVVSYYQSWSSAPQQYAVDVESVNVGGMMKATLQLPSEYMMAMNEASLYVQANQTVGYSDGCPLDGAEFSCSTTTSCSFVIPHCAIASFSGSRFYIWADAPRGSEILFERYDPYIPVVTNDVTYYGSINAMSSDYAPWAPNSQMYRFDLDPRLYDDANYYEKFFVRVSVSNVQQGEVGFAVNSGYLPWTADAGCASPMFLDTTSCSSVSSEEECWVELQYSTLLALAGGNSRSIPKTFWLTVFGLSQDCELHSIDYSLVVQTNWVLTYYPIDETICNVVEEQQYNFHRLRPKFVESPQSSILRMKISDLDAGENVELLVRDRFLASSRDTSDTFSVSSVGLGSIDVEYICGYDDLYLSVYGVESQDGMIDYNMSVDKVSVPVKELFDDSVYHADDDDDDACPHEHDFYRFRTESENPAGSFFRVLVDSEFPTQVYVNKGDFAWRGCADSGYGENDPAVTGTTSVNVYDFCFFADGSYFITVVSDGPYYIYTDVRDDTKELVLGEVFRDELEPGMYQMYTLEICKDWYEADDRLVVEITDVDNGDVYGWIRLNGNAGDPDEFGYNTCSEATAFADYGAGESGYDFLLVSSCDLNAGTYHILIRASPHEGSPERNGEHVSFRLYPYLVDYQIDPVQMLPDQAIFDVVAFDNINSILRNAPTETNWYTVRPPMEDQGYYEQVSQAVARVSNVEGGLVRVIVKCGHLATDPFHYIQGERYGIVPTSIDDEDSIFPSELINPEWKMQSGRNPFKFQPVENSDRVSTLDSECFGCSDLCCAMSYDDLDQYNKDKSCAVWVPSCYWIWDDFYVSVVADVQFSTDNPINYNLQVDVHRDFTLIQPNTNKVSSFANDNWDYDFFYSISAEPQSMRWRVVVTEGEGVLVTVRNHRCPRQATWSKSVWCDADYFDRPWMCDVEIPTRAAHPGDNAYFVSVYGKNATYSIAFWRGRENCHDFTGSGRNEGLDFCAGLVPYATWRWDDYSNLDNEAECFFEELYQHFRVQPCWTGVTPECNATLQSFACHESFRRCDEQGFYTGTCRDSCEAVVYECANWFETVDLEHYNCTSSRYIDQNAGVCSGDSAFETFDLQNQVFLGTEPDLLLFRSSPSSTSSSSLLMANIILTFIAIFAFLF